MLLGEPPPTPADLHFRLLGIPVRVHPFFWITTVFLGLGSNPDPKDILVWVAVVFVSILVHEFGHAMMQRKYGGHPWVTLYGLGGLASCDDCDRTPMRQILILLAGPGAGFLLAGIVVAILKVSGHFDGFALRWIPINWTPFDLAYYFENNKKLALIDLIIWDFLLINILWGLINLLPVYPLDGGQITRELFTLKNPRAGIVQSLQLSIGVAVLVATYALTKNSIYTCAMFGIFAYNNFQSLQLYRNHWR